MLRRSQGAGDQTRVSTHKAWSYSHPISCTEHGRICFTSGQVEPQVGMDKGLLHKRVGDHDLEQEGIGAMQCGLGESTQRQL